MGVPTPLCSDGDRLARLIVRYGFREGVIKMAAELQPAFSPYGNDSKLVVSEIFSPQQTCYIRTVVVEELKNLKLKVA